MNTITVEVDGTCQRYESNLEAGSLTKSCQLCLVMFDPAGTNSYAKREVATKRGSTPERWRRVDAERGFRSVGDVKTRGPGVRPKTSLRSLAPFVAMVQSTDARQCDDLRRG